MRHDGVRKQSVRREQSRGNTTSRGSGLAPRGVTADADWLRAEPVRYFFAAFGAGATSSSASSPCAALPSAKVTA